ncbi:hypothetical protein ES703_73760 [subsurface metagenome]
METNEIISLISNNGLAIVLLVFLIVKGTKFFNEFFDLYHELDKRLKELNLSIQNLKNALKK